MAVNVVSFSFSWCSTGSPGVHSAGCWLSLLHLISNFSGPQTPSGFPRAPSAGCGYPYHLSSITPSPTGWNCNSTQLSWLLSWLSYIIVQRPLDRPLDLWNRMFDRHQAKITVMQFTGHSLPVRQSMSVPWEFFTSSHFFSQFPPTRFPLITAIRMCHFLPVHHLGMAFLAGSKAKIQHRELGAKYDTNERSLGGHPEKLWDDKEFHFYSLIERKCLNFWLWWSLDVLYKNSNKNLLLTVSKSVEHFVDHYRIQIIYVEPDSWFHLDSRGV